MFHKILVHAAFFKPKLVLVFFYPERNLGSQTQSVLHESNFCSF